MKTNKTLLLLLLGFVVGPVATSPGQPAGAPAIETKPAPEQTPPAPADKSAPEAPSVPGAEGEKGLRLNFRGVPLEMVLNYLSDAAGFIIVLETKVEGKVDAWSNQPMSRDEAVNLLNSILKKNGYAAIRNGRTLTIVKQDEAKTRDIPVKTGSATQEIPKTDEMVTQIIPVRHAIATQLTANLQQLLGTYATMTANESANTLLITATQADVRRMTEIINALDDSISGTSTIHVFPLRYADAKELATVIKDLFAPAQQQGNTRGQGGAGGFGGFGGGAGGFGGAAGGFGAGAGAGGPGGGGRGGAGGGAGGGRSGGNAANTRVVAVADERSNSLVVGAPDDMLATIKDVVEKVDQPVNDITELRVFHLNNADPMEMTELFAQLFPDETKSGTSQNQNQGFQFNRGGPGGFGGFGGFGGGNNRSAAQATDTSVRAKKQGRVLAVPDQRTSSIIVSAAKELMPQIAEMVAQLDSSTAKKQRVYVYSLENADVQQVEQILKGMFERSTTQNSRNNANQNSPLTTRSTQTQGATTGTGLGGNSGLGNSGFGNSGGGQGGGVQFGR